MNTKVTLTIVAVWFLLLGTFNFVHAQQPQIPTLQVCNSTKVKGKATIKIDSRKDAVSSGTFTVIIDVTCNPGGVGYPDGTLEIKNVSMSDSIAKGTITAVTFEQVTSTGKHSPTIYLNGRCKVGEISGCRFWMTIADNKRADQREGTPDVVGFLVFDGTGKRVAYGTGPVAEGDIQVAPSSN